MTQDEALRCGGDPSLGGGASTSRAGGVRPFRSPHHTASGVALVGGGGNPRPGEISLATTACCSWTNCRNSTAACSKCCASRSNRAAMTRLARGRPGEFPAEFQLIAAMNPCPCGYLGHFNAKCRCTPDQVARYRGRISGPLIDRIDLQIEVPAVAEQDLVRTAGGEPSEIVRARVGAAASRQRLRQGKPNARLSTREIDQICAPDAAGAALLKQAISRLGSHRARLSSRAEDCAHDRRPRRAGSDYECARRRGDSIPAV